MELLEALILLSILCITYFAFFYWKWWAKKSLFPPGPMPLPFIGNLLQVNINDLVSSLMKLHKKYGSMYTLYLGSQRYVVLCGYKTLKESLIDKGEEFSGRGKYPLFYNFTKGNGIGFSQGQKWKDLRQFAILALTTFGMGKRSLEERIQEEVSCLIKTFKEMKSSHFNPEFFLSRSVCNNISSVLLGDRFDYEDEDLVAMAEHIKNIFKISSSTCGTLYHIFPEIMDYIPGPHRQLFKHFQQLHDFILKKARENEKTLDSSSPRDILDFFLIKIEQERNNPHSSFNWNTLAMSAVILIFAGTESISTTLRFTFIYLMKNPKVQEKVQLEIDHVIGRQHMPSVEHRKQMPYTQAFIHEVQRMADVIPLSLTHSLTKDTEFGGYTFKKGTEFIPLLTSVHFDPTMYENPDTFDPNHFLDENGCFQLNPAFMPFSTGKRICLGANFALMEIFIYITSILQNFTLKPLLSPEETDARPIGIFLANVPQPFKFSLIPR
ncbi:cytochrome P450 2F2-like isoform X1 [Lissotriton helveticus]